MSKPSQRSRVDGAARPRPGSNPIPIERTLDATNVSSPLDNSELHTEADTEEGDLVLPSPLDGNDHSLSASDSKTSRNKDTTAYKVGNITIAQSVQTHESNAVLTRVKMNGKEEDEKLR